MSQYPMIARSMTKEDFQLLLASLGCNLPSSGHLSDLSRPLSLGKIGTLANRFVIQPMEGSDAQTDGSPGLATIRRYERYAAGRAAVIWMEAVAVNMGAGVTNTCSIFMNRTSTYSEISWIGCEKRRQEVLNR